MLLCFLNGGKYLSVSKVSWEGAVRREGSTADMRSQREEEEMGLDPEHSEKTRLWRALRKTNGWHYRQKEHHEGWEGGSANGWPLDGGVKELDQ